MPAQNCEAVVLENSMQAADIYLLKAGLPAGAAAPRAGQFYMLRCWGPDEAPLLSRPISVHEYDGEKRTVSFLYQVKGRGTRRLAALEPGSALALTGPAGNGFLLEGATAVVVGGGIGTAPLLQLAKDLARAGVVTDAILGFRDEPYRVEAFRAVCRHVEVATDTGSVGHKGFVTDLLVPGHYDTVYICGPEVMMEKAARMALGAGVRTYVSKEAKMACGLGACLGCTCRTGEGAPVSVCKDGPVFEGGVFYGSGT